MNGQSYFHLGVDLVAGTLVGALIGYGLDYYFATKPWLLCIFLVIGFAAGINNVLKALKKKENSHD